VRENGRWYVSLFYTAADQLRGTRDIPAHGIDPIGASSPSAAIDNFLTYVANLDVEHLVAALNPNEAAALQRYAPLFLADAQQSLSTLGVTMKISDTAYSVTGQGDTRQVGLTAVHFTLNATQQHVTADITLKDGCFTGTIGNSTGTPTRFDGCKTAASATDMIDKYLKGIGLDDTAPVHKLIDDVRAAFADFSFHGVVVNNVGGKWYVSPIGTYTELFLSVLRALDRKEVDTITDDGTAVVKALTGSIKNVFGGTVTTDPFTTDPFTTDPFTTDPFTTTVDTVTADSATTASTLTPASTTPDTTTPDSATTTTAG